MAGWGAMLYLSLGSTVAAFLVQAWAIKATSASRAGLVMGTEPLWAVVIAVVIGGETLGLIGAFGAVLVLLGTFSGLRIEARYRASLVDELGLLPSA
jgi:drug/metabolite transporter (DMT)-like permease